MNGILIAVEGIDGSGKSTIVRYLEEELIKEGRQVIKIATRETEKELVFQTVVDSYSLNPSSPAYMFFFQLLHAHKADRAKQALEKGKIVIADRWDLSFFVWHKNFGFFSRESDELRCGVSRLAFCGLKPHLGIYLDVSVDKAFDRRMWRGEAIGDVESERRFYDTVVATYRSLVHSYGWSIVSANEDFEHVRKTVWNLVKEAVK